MPDLKSQDLVTHSFHHLKEKAFILPPAAQKEISRQKNVLPRNKFMAICILGLEFIHSNP
ncbi:hypothetical protein APU15_03370 [Klebsiella pneumoniae]|nr:hypothetical protein APU15_03370 [Klebsiella pneumoniae]OCU55015.1 hypothetical protein A6D81_22810 [Klebsiella pneumoniae]